MSWTEKPGFWGIQQINVSREYSFRAAYNLNQFQRKNQDKPLTWQRVGHWINYRGLSVASVPANLLGFATGMIGMLTTALTVGTLKVAIYAITGKRPAFSSGFPECKDRTEHSAAHLWKIVKEVSFEIFEALAFILKRLRKGLFYAAKGEKDVQFASEKTPYPASVLDGVTDAYRIDWVKSDRSFKDIGMHTLLSTINIPMNIVAAACSKVAFSIFLVITIAKALVKAGTNLEIPGKTYTAKSLSITIKCMKNVFVDLRDTAYDSAAAIRKTAQALKINNIFEKIQQLWIYIPQAVIERV